MKILFLPEHYYPHTSGVPVVVKYLAEGLSKRGHDVAIATQGTKDLLPEESINGVKVHRFCMHKDWIHRYIGDTNGYINFVLNCHADATILECTQCITTDVLLPHVSKISGKVFFHVHGISGLADNVKFFTFKSDLKHTLGTTLNWIESKIYFKYTLKKAMPYFTATMCLSENGDGTEYIKKLSRKNYILDNAADNMFYDEACCKRDVIPNYVVLENSRFMLSCANYLYIKNQLGIIEQFYQSESSKQMSLVCIGSKANDYYNNCKKLVKELENEYGHRDVKLLYDVKRQDIPAFVNKATLYLVGSYLEQYSISIIEAMSQGVPFISTNVGNARFLPGGMVINSIDEMQIAIDTLMKDDTMYNRYSSAGRKFAYDNCRIDVAVDKLERIISDN